MGPYYGECLGKLTKIQLENIVKISGVLVSGPYATPEEIAEFMKDHMKQKGEFFDEDEKLHFSYDLEESLTEAEREADKKL